MHQYERLALADYEDQQMLAQMIMDKYRDLIRRKEVYGKLVKKYVEDEPNEGTSYFNKCLLFYIGDGKEIEQEEKALNNMCVSYAYATNLLNSQKYFSKWREVQEKIDSIDIVDVISRYVDVKNPRVNIKCPLHDDRTPSFKIYEHTNSFYCFGCQKGGTHVNFIMEKEGLNYKEAINHLLNTF